MIPTVIIYLTSGTIIPVYPWNICDPISACFRTVFHIMIMNSQLLGIDLDSFSNAMLRHNLKKLDRDNR